MNKDNQQYRIPAYRSANLLFYNFSWSRELGFTETPKTLSGIKEQTCAASRQLMQDDDFQNDGAGGLVFSFNPNSFFSWLYTSMDKTNTINTDSDFFNRNDLNPGAEYLLNLFNENCTWVNWQQQSSVFFSNKLAVASPANEIQPYEYLANRFALLYNGTIEDTIDQQKVSANSAQKDQWSVLPYPSGDGSQFLLVDEISYAITALDPDQALAAWLFIRWMSQTENQVAFIQATGSLPLSQAAADELGEFKAAHPQWAAVFSYMPLARRFPSGSDWGDIKKILRDAAWRLTSGTTTQINVDDLISEADEILNEDLNH